ncbi:hypothetical protein [Comamonas squillarum]|uniref:Phage tail protein n=1 Tax=Comamonas squillarum TaxID=2977320 RepID=A0ABY6A2N5_9BURK|nr:hypothetical protein [Comamonas sp. PR12]UXC19170.1 hypothetical protein N4T19_03315 [Comamonas sp. PR12]
MTTPLKAIAAGGNSAELREWVAGDFLPVALGGTGGTTAAAARSNLGLGSAAVAAIVGTVSQSGGVPTGAIIQRGSNANGEFVRYADGAQICRLRFGQVSALAINSVASGLYVSLREWTFPAAFVDYPTLCSACEGTPSDPWPPSLILVSSDLLPTRGSVFVYHASASTTIKVGSTFNMTAIGRWF